MCVRNGGCPDCNTYVLMVSLVYTEGRLLTNHEPFVLFNWPSKNKDVIEIKHKKKDEPILAMLISQ